MTIRVLVADDHPMYRGGVRAALSDVEDVEIVGEAVDGDQAISESLTLQPDVILMDLHMPGTNGIEATRRLMVESPTVSVLVLTMFDDDESVFAAIRAGARGYLVKGAAQEQIVRAIRAVAGGDVVFGSGVAGRVMTFFTASGRIGARAGRRFPELTEREVEVLELIARGFNNADRTPAGGKRQDRPQSRVECFQQTPRRRSCAGDCTSARIRTRGLRGHLRAMSRKKIGT